VFNSASGTNDLPGGRVCNNRAPQLFYYNPPALNGNFVNVLKIFDNPAKTSYIAEILIPDTAINNIYFGFKYNPAGPTYVARISAAVAGAEYYFPTDAVFVIP
jgi:hypothetical protein